MSTHVGHAFIAFSSTATERQRGEGRALSSALQSSISDSGPSFIAIVLVIGSPGHLEIPVRFVNKVKVALSASQAEKP